jgi:hypothetical protein
MSLRSLVLALLLVAAAVTVARALISRDNLGALEYVAAATVVLGLGLLALQASRRGLRRG